MNAVDRINDAIEFWKDLLAFLIVTCGAVGAIVVVSCIALLVIGLAVG